MTAEYDQIDLDAITYSNSENTFELPILRQLRSRGGGSRTTSSSSRTSTRTTYSKTTTYRPSSYRTYSRYYYSGYSPSTLMATYVLFVYHPASYWNVYYNRGLWGASCQTGMHCRSGCCSSERLSSYYSSYSVPAGGFFCENYSEACGFGPGGSSGGIIGSIVGLIFLCFCCIAAWFICKSC